MNSDAAAPPRALVVVAALLAIGLAVAVAVIGLTSGGEPEPAPQPPLALPAVDAPDARSDACARLMARVPDAFATADDTLERRRLAEPAPEAAAAWGLQGEVTLRCGVPKPVQLTPTSKLLETDSVRWLVLRSDATVTYYAVDRPVYVALTTPADQGTAVLQDVSKAVREAMKPRRPNA